jgi:PAS domain S-box-containing protein
MGTLEVTGLAEMLFATAEGAFIVDAERRILLWNRAAEHMLGYPAREAIGRTCSDLLVGHQGDHDADRLCCRAPHVMDVHHFDVCTRTRSGSTIWVTVSALRVPVGEIGEMTIHLLRDVTATRKLLALFRERLATITRPRPAAPNGNGALTRREVEILRLISTGLNTKKTALKLHVSPATVRNHVQNILGKLSAHSRLEAVAYAIRHDLMR